MYDNRNIIISESNLYFYGINIGLEDIESVDVIRAPRRSIIIGLKEWFYGLIFFIIIYSIWHNSSILYVLGDIYCYSLPLLIIFNIFKFFEKNYILTIRTKSGLEHNTKGKQKGLMLEIKNILDRARELDREKRNSGLKIENSIISTGNNNINKIENKRIYTNYTKIKNELDVLLKHTKEKEIVEEAIKSAQEKNSTKLKKNLSKLGKATLQLIKELGLSVLEIYIEKYIIK